MWGICHLSGGIFKIRWMGFAFGLLWEGWGSISSLYHYVGGSSKDSAWVVIRVFFFFKNNNLSSINIRLPSLVSETTNSRIGRGGFLVDFMGCEEHIRY